MNKEKRKVIFDTLKTHGVLRVVIDFDGGGDSGQLGNVALEGLADPEKFLNLPVPAQAFAIYGNKAHHGEINTFDDFLRAVAWDMLDYVDYDWVNNDGGYGEIEILPMSEEIEIDMSVRFTSSHDYKLILNEDGNFDSRDLGMNDG